MRPIGDRPYLLRHALVVARAANSRQIALTTVMLLSRNPSLISRSNSPRSASARAGMICSVSASISTRELLPGDYSSISHPSSIGLNYFISCCGR